ncbi:MAG TPA: hypothetical protein VKG01_20875 [Thermoanaerobaculia bacterium]|nr:hypothetical protein [Thermoanaerobaculia bacterium]
MKRRWIGFSVISLFVLAAGLALASEKETYAERYTAFGTNQQRGKTGTIQIAIQRWSTPEERQMLVDTLQKQGREALAAALAKMPVIGWIRLANTRSQDLRYAFQTPLPDGGRRVVIGTDRVVNYLEGTTASRTQHYQFSVAEIHFDKDGKGEGKLSPLAKVDIEKGTNQIEVEDYTSQPVRLLQVKVVK